MFTLPAMGVTILPQTPSRQKCQEEMLLFLYPTGRQQQRCHSDTSIRALWAQWWPAEEGNPASLQMVPSDNREERTPYGEAQSRPGGWLVWGTAQETGNPILWWSIHSQKSSQIDGYLHKDNVYN